MSNIKEGLLYSESHEWVKVEGNVAVIGVSDFAQSELGDITYVEMPDVDSDIAAGESFGALESVKASSELYCPVSGKIVEINNAVEDSPELINEDPYGSWIIKVEMSDAAELESLISPEAYAKIAA